MFTNQKVNGSKTRYPSNTKKISSWLKADLLIIVFCLIAYSNLRFFLIMRFVSCFLDFSKHHVGFISTKSFQLRNSVSFNIFVVCVKLIVRKMYELFHASLERGLLSSKGLTDIHSNGCGLLKLKRPPIAHWSFWCSMGLLVLISNLTSLEHKE